MVLTSERIRAAAQLVLLLLPCVVAAQSAMTEDLTTHYGSAEVVSLATGYERPLFDAPATALILTRADIERSGALSLADLLQNVPSYYLSNFAARHTLVAVRGVSSPVLYLINNIPLYHGFLNATASLDNVLLHNVERIEVTRGPGSAVFGADAMAGIVNIITRTASSGPLAEIGASGGNLDARGAHGLYGTMLKETSLRFYGAYQQTDFSDCSVREDAQTQVDRFLGTHASLAPGRINAWRKVAHAAVDLAQGPWALRGQHFKERYGTGAGVGFALDPIGELTGQVSSLELVHRASLAGSWALRSYVAGIRVDHGGEDLHVFPAGAFNGLFPDGVLQAYEIGETRFRGETTAHYTGLSGHALLLGIGGMSTRYKTDSDVRNYIMNNGFVIPTFAFAQGAGIGDPKSVRDAHREVSYALAQDEWTPFKDWQLTLGVRFDDYSDVGPTLNPRAALVWSPSAYTSVKMLYGSAFAPPTIVETHATGVLIPQGNPELEPTTLQMAEISITHRRSRYTASAALFRYVQKNLVDLMPSATSPMGLKYINRAANDIGGGFEGSLEYALSPKASLRSDYIFQTHTETSADRAESQHIPRHKLSVSLDLDFTSHWHAYIGALSAFDHARMRLDPRPAPPDYTLVNFMLERKGLWGNSALSFTVRNLFDRCVGEPNDATGAPLLDTPMPGRSWFIQLRNRF